MSPPCTIQLDEAVEGASDPGLIQILAAEFAAGKSLVPLVGAGLSAPSGVPIASELQDYLTMCIGMALGLDDKTKTIATRWHPKLNEWPSMRGDWLARAKQSELRIEQAMLETKQRQLWDQHRIYREAFGDLSDWRLALLFISRLGLPRTSKGDLNEHSKIEVNNPIQLIDSDSHIIDSFFNHITANKAPSMGHRILAHIAASLRARITLSLNFDELLEQAYEEVGLNPTVFEVHHAAGLPPCSLLGSRNSIIKLHGGKYGVRADLTLDREPTEQERRHFRSYLLGRDWTSADDTAAPQSNKIKPTALANLILLGVSGRDRRVLLFIKDALQHLAELKVFWICRSDRAKKEAHESCITEIGSELSRIALVQHPHLGTLLWEIYQRVMNCVPSSGLEFPACWQLPLVPEPSDDERTEIEHSDGVKKATAWLKGHCSEMPLILESGPDRNLEWGVSSLAWELFRKSLGSHNPLWLDGEDLACPDDIRERLFQAVCSNNGESHQLPPLQRLSEDDYFDDLEVRTSKSGKPWILFLNLRGHLGYSANLFYRLSGSEPPDWGDQSEARSTVEAFIIKLCQRRSLRIRLVLMKRSDQYQGILSNKDTLVTFPTGLPPDGATSWASKRVQDAALWANSELEQRDMRWRLLRAIAVFPLVRHNTALVARSIARIHFEERWGDVWREVDTAVRLLVRKKVLRRKPGGFLWMHWQVRDELRKVFDDSKSLQPTNERDRLDIQTGLGDWCMTLFHATHDPLAAFQAIFHRCRVAQFSWRHASSNTETRSEDLVRMRSSLCEVLNHLEEARASILAWGNRLDAQRCLCGVFQLLTDIVGYCRARDPEARRNRRFLQMARARVLLYQVWLFRDLGDSEQVIAASDQLSGILTEANGAPVDEVDEFKMEWPTEHYLIEQQCRLERAVVCISLRKYTEAKNRLRVMAHDVGLSLDSLLSATRDKEVEQVLLSWAHCDGSSATAGLRYERRRILIFVLRRMMETLLLEHEARALVALSKGRPHSVHYETDALDKAQRIYIAARMLPRFVTEDEYSSTRIERSRLHSVLAGVLMCKGDFQGVQRHINEAWSATSHLPESEEFIARCVVDLRRVYCLLHELVMLDRVRTFAEWMMCDFGPEHQLPDVTKDDVVRLVALLGDARVILDRIECRMNHNRKSLWWWMTLRRYQLVVLQYGELVRLLKRSVVGLRVGLESMDTLNMATYDEGEKARLLLSEAARRVSSDIFQMARLAHNGLNFARMAFMNNIFGDPRPDKENWRLCNELWRECIEYVLEKLISLRHQASVDSDNMDVDSNVKAYVEHVVKQLHSFLGSAG